MTLPVIHKSSCAISWNEYWTPYWSHYTSLGYRLTRTSQITIVLFTITGFGANYGLNKPLVCFENQGNACFELFLFILIAIYGQRYDFHRHQIFINKIFDIFTLILVAFIEEKVPNTLSVSCFIMPKLFCQPFWTPS